MADFQLHGATDDYQLLQQGQADGGGGAGPPVVDAIADRTDTVGDSISLQASATGGDGALTWTATGLPPGLSIASGTGLISGTLTTAGSYSATVTATDESAQSDDEAVAWTVNAAPGGGGDADGVLALTKTGFEKLALGKLALIKLEIK